jgi:DNA-binding Lrp family transcriptional regulator
MIEAFVLIQTQIGQPASVIARLRQVDGVTVAVSVSGPYDVIARVEAESVDALGQMVVSAIQGVDGVTRTLTCPIIHL